MTIELGGHLKKPVRHRDARLHGGLVLSTISSGTTWTCSGSFAQGSRMRSFEKRSGSDATLNQPSGEGITSFERRTSTCWKGSPTVGSRLTTEPHRAT